MLRALQHRATQVLSDVSASARAFQLPANFGSKTGGLSVRYDVLHGLDTTCSSFIRGVTSFSPRHRCTRSKDKVGLPGARRARCGFHTRRQSSMPRRAVAQGDGRPASTDSCSSRRSVVPEEGLSPSGISSVPYGKWHLASTTPDQGVACVTLLLIP